MKVGAILPALNAARFLPQVIGAIRTAQPQVRVLVVDDDDEVHDVTRFVLHDLRIFGRPLNLLYAHSARQARAVLRQHPDTAVALLDVVMETERAGLDLVGYLRDELNTTSTTTGPRANSPTPV